MNLARRRREVNGAHAGFMGTEPNCIGKVAGRTGAKASAGQAAGLPVAAVAAIAQPTSIGSDGSFAHSLIEAS